MLPTMLLGFFPFTVPNFTVISKDKYVSMEVVGYLLLLMLQGIYFFSFFPPAVLSFNSHLWRMNSWDPMHVPQIGYFKSKISSCAFVNRKVD